MNARQLVCVLIMALLQFASATTYAVTQGALDIHVEVFHGLGIEHDHRDDDAQPSFSERFEQNQHHDHPHQQQLPCLPVEVLFTGKVELEAVLATTHFSWLMKAVAHSLYKPPRIIPVMS